MALIKRYGTYYADFREPNGKRKRISLQTTNLRVANEKYAVLVSRRKKAKENLTNYATLLPANLSKTGWNSIQYVSYSATGPSK